MKPICEPQCPRSCIAIGAAVFLSLSVDIAGGADWPSFRGPSHTGASKETKWNADFDEPKIAWKKDVGIGAASFVVRGNRVITAGNKKNQDVIWCFDIDTGRELWQHKFRCKFDKRMFEGGTAATPTIDGDFVYNLAYDGQLRCVKLADGKLVWKKHLLKDFGGKLSEWKYAGSPLVYGDKLIVDCGGRGNSTLALNKRTGAKIWGNGKHNAGYAMPIPGKIRGKDVIFVFKGKAMVAHEPGSGKQIWEQKWKTSYDVNASSPVPVGGGKLVVSSGYPGGRAVLFDVSRSKPRQLWRNNDIKTKMSSCVVHDGAVFAVCGDTSGKLVCVSLNTGKTLWTQGGFGMGTLTLAGDKLIMLGERGNLVIAKASSKGYEPITEAQILPSRCWVNPVIANGRILCKNNKGKTVCIDVR